MKTRSRLRDSGRNSRGGFTLVELIVVLVILAIMAAFLIPTLTGYIDKARQKQIIIQTRQAVMAAQTLFDEAYGSGLSASINKRNDDLSQIIDLDELYELAELNNTELDNGQKKFEITTVKTDEPGRISILIMTVRSEDGSSITCTYNAKNESEPYTISNS